MRVESSNANAASAASPDANNAQPKIGFEKVPTTPEEPLRAELRSFLRIRPHASAADRGWRRRPPRSRTRRPRHVGHPRTRPPRPTIQLRSTGRSMIARILVPKRRAPAHRGGGKKQKPPARFETYMDDRMVVPSGLSDAPPLNGKSSIPSHFPLEVLVRRSLVGRDIEPKPFDLSGRRAARAKRRAHRGRRLQPRCPRAQRRATETARKGGARPRSPRAA